MSVCRNCHRENKADVGCYAGPFFFCSFLCRDTSEELRGYEQMKAAEARLPKRNALLEFFDELRDEPTCSVPTCGIPNCFVCSGAMRERAGKGDNS